MTGGGDAVVAMTKGRRGLAFSVRPNGRYTGALLTGETHADH
jgi:hypothetical protein